MTTSKCRATIPVIAVATTSEYRKTLLKLVQSTDVVVEVGCAHGVTSLELAKRAKLVVGLDMDLKMINAARCNLERTLMGASAGWSAGQPENIGSSRVSSESEVSGGGVSAEQRGPRLCPVHFIWVKVDVLPRADKNFSNFRLPYFLPPNARYQLGPEICDVLVHVFRDGSRGVGGDVGGRSSASTDAEDLTQQPSTTTATAAQEHRRTGVSAPKKGFNVLVTEESSLNDVVVLKQRDEGDQQHVDHAERRKARCTTRTSADDSTTQFLTPFGHYTLCDSASIASSTQSEVPTPSEEQVVDVSGEVRNPPRSTTRPTVPSNRGPTCHAAPGGLTGCERDVDILAIDIAGTIDITQLWPRVEALRDFFRPRVVVVKSLHLAAIDGGLAGGRAHLAEAG